MFQGTQLVEKKAIDKGAKMQKCDYLKWMLLKKNREKYSEITNEKITAIFCYVNRVCNVYFRKR